MTRRVGNLFHVRSRASEPRPSGSGNSHALTPPRNVRPRPAGRFLAGAALTAAVGVLIVASTVAGADSSKEKGGAEADDSGSSVWEWNVTMKTMGGRMLWGDVYFFHDWRIQQNILDGHYRLLDGDDVRHASGTFEECKACLEEIRRDRALPAMSGKAVVFVHGIIRSSKSFNSMKTALRDAGYQVFGFDYPSTQVDIETAAGYLRQALQSLEGVEEINFVVHSMGGLVVRACLQEYHDPRLHRMVMLAVPNLGARMANLVQKNLLYRTIFGPAGQQLTEDADGLIGRLPTPPFEFAVVAGARGTLGGFNPLIPGDDDGTVSVASTRLPGAADFMTVRALHSFLMNQTDVVSATARFLLTGALRESGERHPIPPRRSDAPKAASTSE